MNALRKLMVAAIVLFFMLPLFSEEKKADAVKNEVPKEAIAEKIESSIKMDPVQALQYLESQEQKIEKWVKVKAKKGTKAYIQKDRIIQETLDETVDYTFFASYALGDKWDTASPDKQKILYNKLRHLFSEFYLEEIFYNDGYQKSYIEKDREKKYIKGKDESVYVISEIQVTVKNKPVVYEVIYHLYPTEDGKKYMIFDIELDSVSIARNYREQFDKKYKDENVDTIIKKLDEKIEEKDKEAKSEKKSSSKVKEKEKSEKSK